MSSTTTRRREDIKELKRDVETLTEMVNRKIFTAYAQEMVKETKTLTALLKVKDTDMVGKVPKKVLG